jgi:hypothetical protein
MLDGDVFSSKEAEASSDCDDAVINTTMSTRIRGDVVSALIMCVLDDICRLHFVGGS